MVVLSKEVVGGLAKVLYIRACTHTDRISEKIEMENKDKKRKGKSTDLPGWGNGLRERHLC